MESNNKITSPIGIYAPGGKIKTTNTHINAVIIVSGFSDNQSQVNQNNSDQSKKSTVGQTVEIFFSYAHEDEALRDELAKHLKLLERQEIITAWHDRQITAGDEWKNEIDTHLETADIILLLISADFLASDYCYDIELKRAIERHERKEARVIPIILRSVDWHNAPFGKIAALPTNGKPVTDWPNQDKAFTDVVKGISKAIEQIRNPSQDRTTKEAKTTPNFGENHSGMHQTNRDQSTGFQINVSGGTVNINPPNQPPPTT
jgi:TIR domain